MSGWCDLNVLMVFFCLRPLHAGMVWFEYVSQSARWNSISTESVVSVGGTSEMISL